MKKLLTAAVAGFALLASAASASAATVLSWAAGDTGVGQTLNFNGFSGDPIQVIPGLTAEITYTLSSVTNGGTTWTFNYAIENTSSAPVTGSRIRSFGFDTSGNLSGASSTGTYAYANTPSNNIPNGIGTVDACFKATSNGQCGGGSDGLTLGQSGGGTLVLTFGSALSSLDLSNFYVRYQSITGVQFSSASGVPVEPPTGVPEPATWAMMITGFGLAGSAIRRRRGKVAFA